MSANLKAYLNRYVYRDEVTVKRAVHTTEGDIDGFTDYVIVYDNLRGHLAQYGTRSSGYRDDSAMHLTENYRVSVDPELDIRVNDWVDVIHDGDTYRLFVIKVFKYISHQELDCNRRKEAGQF